MKKIKDFWNKNILNKIIIVFGGLIIFGIIVGAFSDDETINSGTKINLENKKEVEVINFYGMSLADISSWCETNNINCYTKEEYSDSVAAGEFIKQSVSNGIKVFEDSSITITYSLGIEPSQEYKNALAQAETYSEMMNMSKDAIYDQLVSKYGGQFEKEAAQYAIDNIIADWNENALAQAKTYQETLNMSKNAIYDQLISKYGGQFTKSEAQYAIDHLDD